MVRADRVQEGARMRDHHQALAPAEQVLLEPEHLLRGRGRARVGARVQVRVRVGVGVKVRVGVKVSAARPAAAQQASRGKRGKRW